MFILHAQWLLVDNNRIESDCRNEEKERNQHWQKQMQIKEIQEEYIF